MLLIDCATHTRRVTIKDKTKTEQCANKDISDVCTRIVSHCCVVTVEMGFHKYFNADPN